jgi:hypothetical protein
MFSGVYVRRRDLEDWFERAAARKKTPGETSADEGTQKSHPEAAPPAGEQAADRGGGFDGISADDTTGASRANEASPPIPITAAEDVQPDDSAAEALPPAGIRTNQAAHAEEECGRWIAGLKTRPENKELGSPNTTMRRGSIFCTGRLAS